MRACSISSCLEVHPSPGDGILPSSASGGDGTLQPRQNRGRPVSRPPCYCASDQARRQSKLLASASDQRVVHAPERQRTCGRCARIAMAAGRAGAWPAPPSSPAATSSCLEAYQAALRCQAVRHLPLRGHPLSRHGERLNPTKAGRGALSRACNRCGDELEPSLTLRSSSIAPYYLTRWVEVLSKARPQQPARILAAPPTQPSIQAGEHVHHSQTLLLHRLQIIAKACTGCLRPSDLVSGKHVFHMEAPRQGSSASSGPLCTSSIFNTTA